VERCCRRDRDPKTAETTISSFEDVAFGLMLGGWMLTHGLYVLQVLRIIGLS